MTRDFLSCFWHHGNAHNLIKNYTVISEFNVPVERSRMGQDELSLTEEIRKNPASGFHLG